MRTSMQTERAPISLRVRVRLILRCSNTAGSARGGLRRETNGGPRGFGREAARSAVVRSSSLAALRTHVVTLAAPRAVLRSCARDGVPPARAAALDDGIDRAAASSVRYFDTQAPIRNEK